MSNDYYRREFVACLKILAVTLACLMLATMLSGCSTQTKNHVKTDISQTVSTAATVQRVDSVSQTVDVNKMAQAIARCDSVTVSLDADSIDLATGKIYKPRITRRAYNPTASAETHTESSTHLEAMSATHADVTTDSATTVQNNTSTTKDVSSVPSTWLAYLIIFAFVGLFLAMMWIVAKRH